MDKAAKETEKQKMEMERDAQKKRHEMERQAQKDKHAAEREERKQKGQLLEDSEKLQREQRKHKEEMAREEEKHQTEMAREEKKHREEMERGAKSNWTWTLAAPISRPLDWSGRSGWIKRSLTIRSLRLTLHYVIQQILSQTTSQSFLRLIRTQYTSSLRVALNMAIRGTVFVRSLFSPQPLTLNPDLHSAARTGEFVTRLSST
jgi:hypothetical protein